MLIAAKKKSSGYQMLRSDIAISIVTNTSHVEVNEHSNVHKPAQSLLEPKASKELWLIAQLIELLQFKAFFEESNSFSFPGMWQSIPSRRHGQLPRKRPKSLQERDRTEDKRLSHAHTHTCDSRARGVQIVPVNTRAVEARDKELAPEMHTIH